MVLPADYGQERVGVRVGVRVRVRVKVKVKARVRVILGGSAHLLAC